MNWFVVNSEVKADSLSELVLVELFKIHIDRCIVGVTYEFCEHKHIEHGSVSAEVEHRNARTHAEKLVGQLYMHVCMQGQG